MLYDEATSVHEAKRWNVNEWHTLVFGLLGALVTGFIYAYSTYSNALQHALNLEEWQKELIGIAPSVCNLVTTSCGIILDRTSVRFCLLLAAVLMSGSYVVYGLVGFQVLRFGSATWSVCFGLSVLGSYGASFVVACVFSTLAKNFEAGQRSSVVSVAKAWVGVAAGVGTSIYVGLFADDDHSTSRLRFLFFLAIITGVVPVAISPVLQPIPHLRRSLTPLAVPLGWRLPAGYALSVVLIATTLASSVHPSSATSIALLLILASPLALLVPKMGTAVTSPSNDTNDLLHNGGAPPMPAADSPPASPLECGPAGMVRHLEFYLLFAATFALQAGGLFLTTNLGSMVESRSGPAVASATVVTVFSCFQASSRLVTGLVSDALLKRGLPRTIVFPLLALLMAGAHGVLCVPGPTALLVGCGLGGVGFGATYPLLVLCVTEIFGKARVASNYMVFDGTPGAIGALLIAQLLASHVYSAHTAPGASKCVGDACFRLAHLIVVAVELAGCVAGVLLALRTRAVYRLIARGS